MTLHVYEELEQGSEEWLAARCGVLTASVIGGLVTVGIVGPEGYGCPDCGALPAESCISKASKTPKVITTHHGARSQIATEVAAPLLKPATGDTARGITLSLAAERITGRVDPAFVSFDMQRGKDEEPLARDLYAKHNQVRVDEVGFMRRDEDGYSVGYSPDGLVNTDGLIEVKSRRQKGHVANVIGGKVPAENMAQIQCGLWVSGRKWCDYLDYSNGMAMWPVRVHPDPAWFAVLEAVARRFTADVALIETAYQQATTDLPVAEYVEPFTDDIQIGA